MFMQICILVHMDKELNNALEIGKESMLKWEIAILKR